MFLNIRAAPEVSVGTVMTRKMLTVSAKRTADVCIALVSDKRVRHLPVIVKGQLVVIIAIGDPMMNVAADREIDLASRVD